MVIITPAQRSCWGGGVLVSLCPSVRPSVCPMQWLGPNIYWKISQIWIEYIKPIGQMSLWNSHHKCDLWHCIFREIILESLRNVSETNPWSHIDIWYLVCGWLWSKKKSLGMPQGVRSGTLFLYCTGSLLSSDCTFYKSSLDYLCSCLKSGLS